jgi:hypothetical protein
MSTLLAKVEPAAVDLPLEVEVDASTAESTVGATSESMPLAAPIQKQPVVEAEDEASAAEQLLPAVELDGARLEAREETLPDDDDLDLSSPPPPDDDYSEPPLEPILPTITPSAPSVTPPAHPGPSDTLAFFDSLRPVAHRSGLRDAGSDEKRLAARRALWKTAVSRVNAFYDINGLRDVMAAAKISYSHRFSRPRKTDLIEILVDRRWDITNPDAPRLTGAHIHSGCHMCH